MGVRMDSPAKLSLVLVNSPVTELSGQGKAGKGLLPLRHSLAREHQLNCYKLLPHLCKVMLKVNVGAKYGGNRGYMEKNTFWISQPGLESSAICSTGTASMLRTGLAHGTLVPETGSLIKSLLPC